MDDFLNECCPADVATLTDVFGILAEDRDQDIEQGVADDDDNGGGGIDPDNDDEDASASESGQSVDEGCVAFEAPLSYVPPNTLRETLDELKEIADPTQIMRRLCIQTNDQWEIVRGLSHGRTEVVARIYQCGGRMMHCQCMLHGDASLDTKLRCRYTVNWDGTAATMMKREGELIKWAMSGCFLSYADHKANALTLMEAAKKRRSRSDAATD